MYDLELVLEDLRHVAWSLDHIQKRFSSIVAADDFMKDDVGLEKLDSQYLLATDSNRRNLETSG